MRVATGGLVASPAVQSPAAMMPAKKRHLLAGASSFASPSPSSLSSPTATADGAAKEDAASPLVTAAGTLLPAARPAAASPRAAAIAEPMEVDAGGGKAAGPVLDDEDDEVGPDVAVASAPAPPRVPAHLRCARRKCKLQRRTMSKYCTDRCGLAVAQARLARMPPLELQRVVDSHMAAVREDENAQSLPREQLLEYANEQDENELEAIEAERSKIADGRERVAKRKARLESLLDDAAGVKAAEPPTDASRAQFDCATCGQSFGEFELARHLIRCGNKAEASFASHSVVDNVDKTLYCGTFQKSKGYCTKLKTLCPWHLDERLKRLQDAAKGAICAYPSPAGRCMVARETCAVHAGWVNNYTAEAIQTEAVLHARTVEADRREHILFRVLRQRATGDVDE